MKKLLLATVALASAASSLSASTFVGSRSDFRDETIYFAMTTRFYDGDPSNNTYCWDGKLNVNDPEWRGDFKGLIEKLDYIKALGFTAVWITPVVENASGLDYHGYHAFNFSKVDPRYESEDVKFQDLIDAAHQRGMKIILDIVIQHTGNFGEDHLAPMFVKDYTQNLSNIDKTLSLHPDTQLPSNYFSMAGSAQYQSRLALMKNTDGKNHDTHNYWHHYGSNWNWDEPNRWWGQIAGDCVDLNTEHPAVAEYLADCYGKFIAMGVDGFRIDTAGHISRLAFNKNFIPRFQELGEKYKSKRLNEAEFFMFGEVCARYSEATYRGNDVLSPYFYTWKEDKDYAWDNDPSSWDNLPTLEPNLPDHINIESALQQGDDYAGTGHYSSSSSDNAFLKGNEYHTPDHSRYSGLSVIDFTMHWDFGSAQGAFGVKKWDGYYNDATYNVVYVESHDYGPDSFNRYEGGTTAWAENMDLMFTFRGIPCLYYGGEVEFRKGHIMDKGTLEPLANTGRAYFGGYLTGEVNTTDFGQWSDATGNLKATLTSPLSIHLSRLNRIRAAVPALRKGQYSTEGCSGSMAFKRRYTDATTDSYCLVTISGNATFSGIENGTYVDCITGDTQTVTDGRLIVTCSGKANMRVYVLSTSLTPAPGKIGEETEFLYGTTPAKTTQSGYDGHEEDGDTVTVRDDEPVVPPTPEEPEEPIDPSYQVGEYAVFFDNSSSNWTGGIRAWVWCDGTNYTGGNWPGESCTYLGNNIWKWLYTGDEEIPDNSFIIFNDGSSQTSEMEWVNGGLYSNGRLIDVIEPLSPDQPYISISPKTSTYTSDFDITIKVTGASEAYYTINDGNRTDIAGASATIHINETDYAIGETFTVKVVASDATTTVTSQASYTREPKPAEVVIFWDNSVKQWSQPMVHYFGGDSDSKWPGVKMTLVGNNLWTYSCPAHTTGLVFNNGSDDQTRPDFTAINYHIYNQDGDQGTSAVSEIIADNEGNETWYNLHGQIVENPTPGVYIVRNGQQVRKVVVR